MVDRHHLGSSIQELKGGRSHTVAQIVYLEKDNFA